MQKLVTHTTQAAIKAALKAQRHDIEAVLTFKPLNDPVWVNDGDFGDALGSELTVRELAVLSQNKSEVYALSNFDQRGVGTAEARLVNATDVYFTITAKHLASLTIIPPAEKVAVEGLEHGLEFHTNGTLKVGCSTITKKGCEQAFRALAKHLGYTLTH